MWFNYIMYIIVDIHLSKQTNAGNRAMMVVMMMIIIFIVMMMIITRTD